MFRRLSALLPILGLALGFGLVAGCAAQMAESADGAPMDGERRVTFSTEGGCLRASGDPAGDCLANPNNCSSIEVEYDDATGLGCEVCYGPTGEVLSSHCGQVADAECTRMENNLGETCTICRTATGDTVVDTCHDQQTGTDDLRCETYTSPADEVCELCTNAYGDVVSQTCYAPDYWCEDWLEGGLECRRCYEGDVLVSESCGGATLVDPDNCTTITSDDGTTCYTCTDEAGNVVDHNCSGPEAIYCESYFTSDGATCEECYDVNGALVSHECSRDAPPVEVCNEYRSEGNICLICTDPEGNITHRDCRPPCSDEGVVCLTDADCAEGAACLEGFCGCLPPPPCDLFTTQDGTLCEICGDLNGDGVVNEADANCFPNPTDPVYCWDEERSDSASGDVLICTICESETGGITEQCVPIGSVTGPDVTCAVEQTADGRACEVCRDANGAVVHTSCDDLFCREDEVPPLGGDNTLGVLCQICDGPEDQLVSMACDMQNVCSTDGSTTPPDGGGLPPGGDPDDPGAWYGDPCGNVWMSREPVQCRNNAWEQWWLELHPEPFMPLQEGEVLRAYYRETQQPPIHVFAYRIEHAFDVDYCTSCDCPRGDIIFIYVSMEAADQLAGLGWRYEY